MTLVVIYYCPLCARNDFKSQRGVLAHIKAKHANEAMPPWWAALIEGRG